MPTTTSFDEFLDVAEPDGAQERACLHECAQGEASTGRYDSSMLDDERLFINDAQSGMTLLLVSPEARAAFIKRLRRGLSEPGASFEGDAEFERQMAKGD